MPGYCDPWPENMNTTGRSAAAMLAADALRLQACAATSASRSSLADDQRRGDDGTLGARRAACRRHRPGRARDGARRWSPSRRRGRRRAPPRCAPTARAADATRPLASARRRGGASSSTTCALVPPTPNELTAGAARRPVALPRLQPGGDVERARREVDGRVRRSIVHRRRDGAVLQREHRLDQPGDAGRAGQVAEVRLHRADAAEPAPVGASPEHLGERRELDRIAEDRAGAVRLDVADRVGRDAGAWRARRGSPRPGRGSSGAV